MRHAMQPTPEIAIIDANTLTCIGLRELIERMMPMAVVRPFNSFGQFVRDTPDMYVHYFVSSQIYFAHTSFFMERRPKTIVLSNGEQPSLYGVLTLNYSLSRNLLVKSIIQLRNYGHKNDHPNDMQVTEHDLSPREIEVLILLTKGYINKEIANKLHIGLTTVITHRKNITEKLGIKSVSGLAVYAIMHGYIEADQI